MFILYILIIFTFLNQLLPYVLLVTFQEVYQTQNIVHPKQRLPNIAW